jgi:hypothetical protein
MSASDKVLDISLLPDREDKESALRRGGAFGTRSHGRQKLSPKYTLWEWEDNLLSYFKIYKYGSALKLLLAIFINILPICLIMLESTTLQSHICVHLPGSGQHSESLENDLQYSVSMFTY